MPTSHDQPRWQKDPATYQVAPQRASHAPGRTPKDDQPTDRLPKAVRSCPGCTGKAESYLLNGTSGERRGSSQKNSSAHPHPRQHGTRGEPRRGRSRECLGWKVWPTWRLDRVPERASSRGVPQLFDRAGNLPCCSAEVWSCYLDNFRTEKFEGNDSHKTSRVSSAGPGRDSPYSPQWHSGQHLALAQRVHHLRNAAASGGSA